MGVERALDRPPGAVALPAVDRRVGRLAAVGLERAGRRRDEPAVGVVRVDGERPGVAALPPGVSPLPVLAAVTTPGGAVPARLVGAARSGGVPGEAVRVAGGAGPVVAERG